MLAGSGSHETVTHTIAMSYSPTLSEGFSPGRPANGRTLESVSAVRGRRPAIRQTSPPARLPDPDHYPIIVHCHLCWDWVWQRPQQFLSRLSKRHRILFVEMAGPDPELGAPLVRFRSLHDYPNVTVVRMQFSAWCWNDGERVDRERHRLVGELLRGPLDGQFEGAVQWFYDPMAVPAFAGRMGESLTVYDCMDELSKFRFAPPEIIEREADLLARADIVFTGGFRLYQAKSRQNRNCHFYGCGVDVEHFGKARLETTAPPPDLAGLPRPVFGYFGVVDERLDYGLIAALADGVPHGSVAIVGPVIKVDSSALPQRPNLHWLGQRAYADLPAVCKGFDVCLMPFALNESTEFINPTKTLEYMAAGRPIVSTAVPDVVHNFGEVVDVTASGPEFVQKCGRAALSPRQAAIERGLQMAAANTWDAIVARLDGHIREQLINRAAAATA